MRWTSMELAALATRAVPGLSPTGVADAADDARDFTSAVVVDAEGNRWRVRAPQHAQAAMRLETEVQVLRGFSTGIRAELPFRVPSVAGATRVEEMRVFVYNHLPGVSLPMEELAGQSAELIQDLGRTVAAIHDLTEAVVDHADLPRYTAERLRQRRLNELDSAAATGKIPAALLRRWEHAMEDKALWSFGPVVAHGDLHEDNLLIEGARVVAVTGWTDLHIGDPADDLAWLIASADQDFSDAVVASYQEHRRGDADEHILRRAALAAEFALAQWLVRGQSENNEQMIQEAQGLLTQLAADIETYGGREIALSPLEGDDGAQPAGVQHSKPVARAGAAATVAGWGEPEDDGEPAVITDASVQTEDTVAAASDGGDHEDEQPTGKVAPLQPRPADSVPPQPALQQDPPTDQIPAYVEDDWEDEEVTGTLPAVSADPTTGSLPIQPDAASEKRAKQKNFFPTSASSAASAASGTSASSASSSSSASSAASAVSGTSAISAPSPAEAGTNRDDVAAQSAPSSSVYERHPGLRPPGS